MTNLTLNTVADRLSNIEMSEMRFAYVCVNSKFDMVTRNGWTTLRQCIGSPSRFNSLMETIKNSGIEVYKNYNNHNGLELSFNKRHINKMLNVLRSTCLINTHVYVEVVDQDTRWSAHPLVDQSF